MGMTPIQLWRMIWAQRILVLISILCFVFLGALVGKMLPKQYEAKTRVMLDIMSPDQVTGQSMTAASAKSFIMAQSELIKDFRVANAVVEHFGWQTKPELIAKYRNPADKTDGAFRRALAQIVIDGTNAYQTSPSSNILEITYRSTSPAAARAVADAVRDAYIQQSLAFKRDTAATNSRWHRQQAEKLKVQLASAEKRKAEFEKQNGIILQDDNVDTESAKLRSMTNATPMAPIIASAPIIPPSALTAQVAQLDSQIATAQRTLGPNHPDIVAMRSQRDAVASAMRQEQAAMRAAARSGPVGPSIASQISSQTQKVLAQRGLVGEAQRLAGEVAVLRDQLAKTASKAADFELQSQSTEIGIQPMGNAVAPDKPITPFFMLFLIGSAIIGLVLGLAIGVVRELLSRRVRGVEDLEMLDGLPVLGMLPARRRVSHRWLQLPFGLGNPQGASAT